MGDEGMERGDSGIVRFEIDPNPETAEYDLLEGIARHRHVAIEELPSLYRCIDHLVQSMFEDPPDREAQVELQFSYAGNRVTITQRGYVKLVPVRETLDG
jgi:hypothetical protein